MKVTQGKNATNYFSRKIKDALTAYFVNTCTSRQQKMYILVIKLVKDFSVFRDTRENK